MERTKSQKYRLLNGSKVSFWEWVLVLRWEVCERRGRIQSMPREIVTAMKTVQPMSVVRGPYWESRRAKMGERAAEAMFAEPKLVDRIVSSKLLSLKVCRVGTYKIPLASPRRR